MENSIKFGTKNNENNSQNENNIKDKINIINDGNNNESIIINIPKDNDKTFNKLCELQKLIKKEFALREFCKYKI
jgi:uncharacterized membrane protein YcaP (DUF421 family)